MKPLSTAWNAFCSSPDQTPTIEILPDRALVFCAPCTPFVLLLGRVLRSPAACRDREHRRERGNAEPC